MSFDEKEVIPTISDKLSYAVNIQDRRAAIKALKNFANHYREDIILYSLKNILKCFQKDHLDKEITKNILQCLVILFIKNSSTNASADTNSRFQNGKYLSPSIILTDDAGDAVDNPSIDQLSYLVADELTQYDSSIIELIINSFVNFPDDFYISLYALQLLQALASTRPEKLKEILTSAIPISISIIVSNVDSSYDPIRNEAILLLLNLVSNNYNLQRLVAFQDIFMKILQIINQEFESNAGSSTLNNNVFIFDCLNLIYNLLDSNLVNQKLFIQSNHLKNLSDYLEKLIESNSKFSNNNNDINSTNNIIIIFKIVSNLFIAKKNSIDFHDNIESSNIFIVILKLIFDPFSNFSPNNVLIKVHALLTLSELIYFSKELKIQLLSLDVPYIDTTSTTPTIGSNESSKSSKNQILMIPVLQQLINWCLFTNSVHLFNLRLASLQAIKCFVSNNFKLKKMFLLQQINIFELISTSTVLSTPSTINEEDKKHTKEIIAQLLSDNIPIGNIFTTLMEYDMDLKLNPYKAWFSSMILTTLMFFDENEEEDENKNDLDKLSDKDEMDMINEDLLIADKALYLKKLLLDFKVKSFVHSVDEDDDFDNFFRSDSEPEEAANKVEESTVIIEESDNGQNGKLSSEKIISDEVSANGKRDSISTEGQSFDEKIDKLDIADSTNENGQLIPSTNTSNESFGEAENKELQESVENENEVIADAFDNTLPPKEVNPQFENSVSLVCESTDETPKYRDDIDLSSMTSIDAMFDLFISSLASDSTDSRILVAYIMFFSIFFFENIDLTYKFIENDQLHKSTYLQKLMVFVKLHSLRNGGNLNNGIDEIISALVEILLSVLYDSCPKTVEHYNFEIKTYEKFTARQHLYNQFVKAISIDSYRITLKKMKGNTLVKKFEPFMSYLETFASFEKDKKTGLPMLYFDEYYITLLIKDNYSRILNSWSSDPTSDPQGKLNFKSFLKAAKNFDAISMKLADEVKNNKELNVKIEALSSNIEDFKAKYDNVNADYLALQQKKKILDTENTNGLEKIKMLNSLISKLNIKVTKLETEINDNYKKQLAKLELTNGNLTTEKQKLGEANKKLEEGINKMSRELFQLNKENAKNLKEISNLKDQHALQLKEEKAKSNKLEESLNKTIKELSDTLDGSNNKVLELETKNKNLNAMATSLENEKLELQNGFAKYERNLINDLNSMSFQLNKCNEDKASMKASINELNKNLDTLETEKLNLVNEAADKSKELISLQGQFDEHVETRDSETKNLKENLFKYQEMIDSLRKEVDDLSNAVNLKNKTISDLEALVDEKTKGLDGLKVQLDELDGKLKTSVKEMDLGKLEINQRVAEIKELELQLESKEKGFGTFRKDFECKITELKSALQEKDEKLSVLEHESEILTSKIRGDMESKVAALAKEKVSVEKQLKDSLESLDKMRHEISKLRCDNDLKIKELQKSQNIKLDEIAKLKGEYTSSIEALNEANKNKHLDFKKEFETKIKSLQQMVKSKETIILKMEINSSSDKDKFDNLSSEMIDLESKITQLEADVESRDISIKNLITEKSGLNAKIDLLSSKLLLTKDLSSKLQMLLEDDKESLSLLEEQLKKRSAELDESNSKIEAHEESISNLNSQIDEMSSKLNDEKHQAVERFNEIENLKKILEKKEEEIGKFINNLDLKDKDSLLKISELESSLNAKELEVANMKLLLEAHLKDYTALKQIIERKEDEIRKYQVNAKKLKTLNDAEVSKLNDQIKEFKGKSTKYEQLAKYNSDEVAKLKLDLENSKAEISGFEGITASSNKKELDLNDEISKLKEALKSEICRSNEFQKNIDSLNADIDCKLKDIESLSNEAKATTDELNYRLSEKLEKIVELETSIAKLESRHEGSLSSLQSKIDSLTTRFLEKNEECILLKTESITTQNEINTRNIKQEEELKKIRKELEAEKKRYKDQLVGVKGLESSLKLKNNELDKSKNELKLRETEIGELRLLGNKLESKDSEIEKGADEIKRKEEIIKEKEEQLGAKDIEIKLMNQSIEELRKKSKDLIPKTDMDDLLLIMSDLDDKLKKYKEKLRKMDIEVSDDDDEDDSDEDGE